MIPLIPATSSSGLVYAGSMASNYLNNITTRTPAYFIDSPQLAMGQARGGASATIRPVDPTSFDFSLSAMQGYNGNIEFTSSGPMIIMTNLPAGAVCLIEAVLNVEVIPSPVNSTAGITNPEIRVNDPGLSTNFPSLESLWATVARFLPTAETVNAASSIANGIGRVVRTVNAATSARRRLYSGSGYSNGSQPRIELMD